MFPVTFQGLPGGEKFKKGKNCITHSNNKLPDVQGKAHEKVRLLHRILCFGEVPLYRDESEYTVWTCINPNIFLYVAITVFSGRQIRKNSEIIARPSKSKYMNRKATNSAMVCRFLLFVRYSVQTKETDAHIWCQRIYYIA